MSKKVTDVETFPISISDPTRVTEQAYERARQTALALFRIDEYGHSDTVDFVRSTDSIVVTVEFERMHGGMGGWSYHYKCSTWIERCEEE